MRNSKIGNIFSYSGFVIVAALVMSTITFKSVNAMRIVNTKCPEQDKTITTYFFGSDDSENKYTNQTIEGDLVIEKGVNVSKYAFDSAIIKGNVLINKGVFLDRWAFKSAKIEGNIVLESDVEIGFQTFLLSKIKGNIMIHNIFSHSPTFEHTLIKGDIIIHEDTYILCRPLLSFSTVEGSIIIKSGAKIPSNAFVNSEINRLVDNRMNNISF